MSRYIVVDPASAEHVKDHPTTSDERVLDALKAADTVHFGWSRPLDGIKRPGRGAVSRFGMAELVNKKLIRTREVAEAGGVLA